MASASSGIAATVLINGSTSHRTYGIPIKLFNDSDSSVAYSSTQAETLRESTILIWDEITMSHKHALELVDRLLQGLMGSHQPFGGKTVLLGGDWRQSLPVIPQSSRGEIFVSTVQQSYLWIDIKKYKLSVNERIRACGNDVDYADFILQMGNGTLTTYDDAILKSTSRSPSLIRIPDDMVFPSDDLEDLIRWTFPHIKDETIHSSNGCILTPLNETVDTINTMAVDLKDGDTFHKLSSDTCDSKYVTTEFMNSVTPSGLPPHDLSLKVGVPLMLIRNIDPTHGYCNGTRLVVSRLNNHSIECVNMTGAYKGHKITLFRIDLISDEKGLGFDLRRRQYPVRLCYAMTINKSQGQTIPRTALYLPKPVFSHGQLYVGFSRTGNRREFKILIKTIKNVQGRFPKIEGVYTKNITFPEVLGR